MFDAHVHLERGAYTIDWINEFIKFAQMRKINKINFIEHSHRFIEFKDIYRPITQYNTYQNEWFNQRFKLSLRDYQEFITRIKETKFPVEITFGIEICYFEGKEKFISDIIEGMKLDNITGSVHWIDNWGFDHYKEVWDEKDIGNAYERYYCIMGNMIRSDLFDIIAHPDSIKCFGHLPPYDMNITYSRIAYLLNTHNLIVEQNAGLYINYKYPEKGMNDNMYRIFKQYGVKMITASDAHRPEDIGLHLNELRI